MSWQINKAPPFSGLVINEGTKPIGEHAVSLKANGLGAGLYTYTIIAGNFQETKQMIISK